MIDWRLSRIYLALNLWKRLGKKKEGRLFAFLAWSQAHHRLQTRKKVHFVSAALLAEPWRLQRIVSSHHRAVVNRRESVTHMLSVLGVVILRLIDEEESVNY